MSATGSRSLVAQALIIGALCAGVSLGVIDPLKARLEAATARLEEARQVAARAGEIASSAPEIIRRQQLTESRRSSVSAQCDLASDASRLNDTITALASSAGVAVQRTQPREQPVVAPAPRPDGRKPIAASRITEFSIEAAGSYASMATFIDALEHKTGFTRIATLHLTRAEEHKDVVKATILSSHYAFRPPASGSTPASSSTANAAPSKESAQ